MPEPTLLRVSVAYAGTKGQLVRELEVAPGATVAQVIALSGIVQDAELSGEDLKTFGIFSRSVDASTIVRDGDRVEIYRKLRVDPKEARRRRAGSPPKAK